MAARAHRHQVRKDGSTPYVAHPVRVAMIAATVFGCSDETVLAAALVHDVIEDSPIDYDDVHRRLGRAVADLCAVLTKDMRLIEPERERAYEEQLARGPWQGRLIKLADVYDNLADCTTAADRRTFIARARSALEMAAGDAELARARQRLDELVSAIEVELGGGVNDPAAME